MQGAGAEAVGDQRLVQDRHIALAVAEDDGVLEIVGAANEATQGLALGAAASRGHEALGDGERGGGGAGHFHADGIVQEGLGEAGDFRRHGGREEQGLAREGHELADLLDVRDEAHVEHAVGLVDDEDLDALKQQLAALEEIEQAAGGGDQHIRAAHDLGFLIGEGDAADEQGHVEAGVGAIFEEAFLDLGRQFAGGLEDEGAGHAGPGASLFKAGQHGQGEGGGLAGAGLGDAENIAALQGVGDGLRLDGGGRGVTGGFDGCENLLAESCVSECHSWVPGRSGAMDALIATVRVC